MTYSTEGREEPSTHVDQWDGTVADTAYEAGEEDADGNAYGMTTAPIGGDTTAPTGGNVTDSTTAAPAATGEATQPWLWFVVLFVSGTVLFGTVIGGKKRKEND